MRHSALATTGWLIKGLLHVSALVFLAIAPRPVSVSSNPSQPGRERVDLRRGAGGTTRRVISRVAVLTLAVLLAIGALAVLAVDSSSATSLPAVKAPRTIVTFGRSASDAEIADLLNAHDVTATAVLTWTSGLTSTHRSYVPRSPEALLAETRSSLVDSYTKGLRGNVIRLDGFTTAYTEADITASEPLQTEARSLLGIRSQLEQALLELRGGTAVAYAVDVTGSARDRVAALAHASNARVVDGGSDNALIKPASFEQAWSDTALAAIRGGELHARMRAILRTADGGSVR